MHVTGAHIEALRFVEHFYWEVMEDYESRKHHYIQAEPFSCAGTVKTDFRSGAGSKKDGLFPPDQGAAGCPQPYANERLGPLAPWSGIDRLGYPEGVLQLDAEVAHRTVHLGVHA